jgi:hypothetical protein
MMWKVSENIDAAEDRINNAKNSAVKKIILAIVDANKDANNHREELI